MLGERDLTAQALNIENLSRGRPQDNLELLQFMKSLYDNVPHNPDYNPIKRRELSKGGQRTHSHNSVTRRNEYNPKRSGDHGERNGGEFGKNVDRLESLAAGVHFDGASGPELRQSPTRTASTTTVSRQKELQGLRERNAALESAILERDHLVVMKPWAHL